MFSTFPKVALCCVIIYWLAHVFISRQKGIDALSPFSSEELKNFLLGFSFYLLFLYLIGDYYPRLSWSPVVYLIFVTILHAKSRYKDSRLAKLLRILVTSIRIAVWLDRNSKFGGI